MLRIEGKPTSSQLYSGCELLGHIEVVIRRAQYNKATMFCRSIVHSMFSDDDNSL